MGSQPQTTHTTNMKVLIALSALVAVTLPAPRPTLLSLPTLTSPPSTPTSSLSRTTTPTTSVQRRRETAMPPRGLTTSACPMVVFRRFPTLSTETCPPLPPTSLLSRNLHQACKLDVVEQLKKKIGLNISGSDAYLTYLFAKISILKIY